MTQIINTLSERIKALRTSLGLTQTQLAEKVGITQRQIAKYEAGEAEPREHTLLLISRALGVTKDSLLGIEEKNNNGKLPLYSMIELQNFGVKDLVPTDYADIILPTRLNSYGVRVLGSSLEPYYEEGEILLIEPMSELPRLGFSSRKKEIYVFIMEDNTFIRHINYSYDEKITMWSPNRMFPSTTITKNELDSIQIIGRVIGSIE